MATTVADADVLVVNQGGVTKQAARSLVNAASGILPVANGGTGVAVSSGASSVVLRDASQNITANSVIEGFSSITASGTQITLTIASVPSYLVTGSGGQVIQLPDATTLQNGVVYLFNNNQSSGAISVNNNSGTLVASIPSGGFTVVSLLSNATAAGSWERHEQAPSNVTWSTNTLDYAGSITSATWNGNAVAINRGGTGAATQQAAINALAGATTSAQFLRGNGTNVVMSAIQAGDVPTLNQNTTGTAAGLSATLASASGGTGQTTYTDGQLLIGNTAGGLTKASLTGADNVAITNGNGSISVGLTAGAYLEFFEHFMSTNSLAGNIAFAATGGSNAIVNAGLGIVAMSTGATASANQQSRLNQAANNAIIGSGAARAIFRFAQSGTTWFDGTLTGALRCGWGDSTTSESANAIYFRSQNGQGIDFVTKSGNVETLTSTGVSFADGVFRSLEILINSTGTQVIAKIDGTTVATHATNIPVGRLIFFTHINRVAATGTAVVANIDSIYLRITPNTPFF